MVPMLYVTFQRLRERAKARSESIGWRKPPVDDAV